MSPDNQHYIRCLEALKDSFLFKDLEVDVLHTILKDMTLEKWSPGAFKHSLESIKIVHFIVAGRLKVFQTNEVTSREYTIFILSKGDVFDILNLLDDEVHDVHWEALDTLEILNVSIENMRKFILLYPKLNQLILKYIGKRIRTLENASIDVNLHNTLARLAKLFLMHINEESQKLQLINNLPNDEIASLIGTTRAVVNRHIQELKKSGAISVKRKQIDIENLETLIAISEEKHTN